MNPPTHDTALDALDRARRAQEQHDRRIDVQLRLDAEAALVAHYNEVGGELAALEQAITNLRLEAPVDEQRDALPQGIAAPLRGARDELANLWHDLRNLRDDVAGVGDTGVIVLEISRALADLGSVGRHLDRAAQLALTLDEQPASAPPTMLEADGTDGFRLRDGSQLADRLEAQS